jgi:4,5-DOPA dioxygenase extradiol
VLILASGNVVHNLRAMAWGSPDLAFDWARRFDDDVRAFVTDQPGRFAELKGHHDYRRAAPTADHFLPLAYVAGLAEAEGRAAEVVLEGCTMGSISMTAYSLPGTAAA